VLILKHLHSIQDISFDYGLLKSHAQQVVRAKDAARTVVR
jgi:hypothetical protein